jgi:hypothetical protein
MVPAITAMDSTWTVSMMEKVQSDSRNRVENAVSGAAAVDDLAVGQEDATGVDQVRAVLGQEPVDRQGVADLDVAALEATARQGAWVGPFARPFLDRAVLPGHRQMDVGVRIGPLDLDQLAGQPDRLVPVVLGGERMVGQGGRGCGQGGHGG